MLNVKQIHEILKSESRIYATEENAMFKSSSNLQSIQRVALGLSFVVLALGNHAVHAAAGFTPAAPMANGRTDFGAVLLSNGKVLVAGGTNGSPLNGVEIYDPVVNTWSAAASLITGRNGHTVTLLPNGKVLVVGGHGAPGFLNSVELYDPASNTWSAAASLSTK